MEYMSPEMILGQGYNKNIDWWSLGILLYELAFGVPPFFDANTNRMYDIICNSQLIFKKPINNSDKSISTQLYEDFKLLVSALLEKDFNKRLGNSNNIEEFNKQPFFNDVNFDLIYNKKFKSLLEVQSNQGSCSDLVVMKNGVIQKKDKTSEISESEIKELIRNFDEEFTVKECKDDSFIAEESISLVENNKTLFEEISV